MASRRVSRSAIDWAAFAARIPESQSAHFKAFKTKHDAYVNRVAALPEEPPVIDWNYYASKLPKSTLVEEFKRAHSAFQVPYPDDKLSKEIDKQEAEQFEAVKVFIQESNQRVEEYKKMAARWEATIPLHKMTREEYVLTFPDQAFGFDQKKYQTMYPHDYDPKYGIPGEVGSGTWNFGPSRKNEKFDNDHH